MRIIFDYQVFAMQAMGGISRYFIELATRLPQLDKEVTATIIAPLHVNRHLQESTASRVGVKIPPFRGKHRILPGLNRAVASQCQQVREADVIHETYYAKKGLAGSKKRVLTVYDMIHERYPHYFSGADLAVPEKKRIAVERADHIIAISETTKKDLIEYLAVPQEKITVIYLGSSMSPDVRVSGETPRRPYILYVGLRGGVKNFTTLLEAYSASETVKSSHLLLCVGGGKFTREELELQERLGVRGAVLQQEADDTLLASLYAKAGLFVYPSYYEGFGLPLLEAMRCGCPVCCSDTSSMVEIAGKAVRYFDPKSVENMRDIIEEIVSSSTEAERLRGLGYEREKLFSWQECARKTLTVYSALA